MIDPSTANSATVAAKKLGATSTKGAMAAKTAMATTGAKGVYLNGTTVPQGDMATYNATLAKSFASANPNHPADGHFAFKNASGQITTIDNPNSPEAHFYRSVVNHQIMDGDNFQTAYDKAATRWGATPDQPQELKAAVQKSQKLSWMFKNKADNTN